MNYYETEDGFLFPFKPYDVQHDFMKNLFEVLESKKHGIFESPTGTGKSLSIICGSLKWLKFEQDKIKKTLQTILSDNTEPENSDDWLSNFAQNKEKKENQKYAKEKLDFIQAHEKKINDIKLAESNDSENKGKKYFDFSHLSAKRRKFDIEYLETLESDEENSTDEENDNSDENLKQITRIFYASRTHSQLLQFMNELKKTPYCDNTTVTVLSARSNLCINESVKKLKKHSLINEKCSELLKANKSSTTTSSIKSKSCGCPFFRKSNLKLLQNSQIREILDIEDLVKTGRELNACPYYSARNTISDAELVVLPYNILLHKPTRESYGISLKNSIVIMDEAHNLLDAISNMYSTEITLKCLHDTSNQLSNYLARYKTRFSPLTLLNLKQISVLIQRLITYISKLFENKVEQNMLGLEECNVLVLTYHEFISAANIIGINYFDLVQFSEESYLGNKLMGFSVKQGNKSEENSKSNATTWSVQSNFCSFLNQITKPKTASQVSELKLQKPFKKDNTDVNNSAFFVFLEFLKTLTLPVNAGRFMVKKENEDMILKFLHLNPSLHFEDLTKDARSVILAGGTMEPVDDFKNHLFSVTDKTDNNICFYSYGHVVSPENIVVLPVFSGFNDVVLDFTYQSRADSLILEELSKVLINLSSEIPGGMVCFFPSYLYEQHVYTYMHKSGAIAQLSANKTLFREPKEASAVEAILNEYTTAVHSKSHGALIFCVVNGKMSEGINFSDDLCRCVVMIGMPYPNKNSPELQEKLKHLKQFGPHYEAEYCSNLCMKAVNQSIGRAIRHKYDYAAIILLDRRYCSAPVQTKLPMWIKKSLKGKCDYPFAASILKKFFSNVKKKNHL